MKIEDGKLMVEGRISFPKIWAAEHFKKDPNSAKRFGCQILLPKEDTAAKKEIDDEIARLSKEHFKGKVPKTSSLFIKDGDGEDGDEHSAGCWTISANRSEGQGPPQIVGRSKEKLRKEDGVIQAGYRCRFVISIYKPKGYDILSASLEVVQFVRKDAIIGAGEVDVDAVLPDLPEEEEDFDV